MRRERFADGGGRVHILERNEDWARLAPSLRRLVPPVIREAWQTFPRSFEERARRAGHPGLKRWLEACSRGPCRLRIYDTKHFGRAALLEVLEGRALLDFRPAETRTKALPPSAPKSERRARTPAALAEVYRAVGGIRTELNVSGSLVPPDALRPLPRCWGYDDDHLPENEWRKPTKEEFREEARRALPELREQFRAAGLDASFMTEESLMTAYAATAVGSTETTIFRLEDWLANCPGGLTYARAAKMVPFYEDSGDFLCFDGKGQATWIGWETGGVMAFGSVSEALTAYFDSLLSGTHFTNTFAPSE